MGKQASRFVGMILAVGTALVAVPSTGFADASGAWETVRNEDGIVVQRKEVAGSPFVAFRGEGNVDAPLLLVGSVLVDVARSNEWVDSVVDSRVLRRVSETEYVTYSHVGTPITMSDRDFVTDVTFVVDPGKKLLAIKMKSVADPSAPKTDYVRGELTDSSFTLTSIDGGKRTHVAAEIHCDPKGSVAAWIVNLFQNNWGYKTLTSLRKQVAKSDVAVHAHLKKVLEDKGFFAGVDAPAAPPSPPPAPAPAAPPPAAPPVAPPATAQK